GPSACLAADERASLMSELERRTAAFLAPPQRRWLADIVFDMTCVRSVLICGPCACLAADERASLMAELERRNAEFLAHPERRWLAEMISDLSGDLQIGR